MSFCGMVEYYISTLDEVLDRFYNFAEFFWEFFQGALI